MEAKLALHAKWLASKGLEGARLDLSSANLSGLDFSSRSLESAVLRGCQLSGASFVHSDLRFCDFSQATGMQHAKFAGADLFGATITESDPFGGAAKGVADALAAARGVLLTAVLACIYIWLALAQTTDSNLIGGKSELALPIIETKVGTVAFFWIAPIILTCIYFYELLCIRRVWEQIARLPRFYPSGDQSKTRFALGVLEAGLARDRFEHRLGGFALIETGVTVALAWLLVPLTLVLIWARYLPMHDPLGTLVQMISIFLAALVGGMFWRQRHGATDDAASKAFTPALRNSAAVATAVAVLLWAHSIYSFTCPGAHCIASTYPRARLSGVAISTRTSEWSEDKATAFLDSKQQLPGRIPGAIGASLEGRNLRKAELAEAFLVNAVLREVDLEGADLRGADLRGADLSGANLRGAKLTDADLRGTLLSHVALDGADLRSAKFQYARIIATEFRDLDLAGLEFLGVRLEGVRFVRSRMTPRVKFQRSELTLSEFRDVDMQGATFDESVLTITAFDHVNVGDVSFRGATLRDIHFDRSILTRAVFANAVLETLAFKDSLLKSMRFENVKISCPITYDERIGSGSGRFADDAQSGQADCFSFEDSITHDLRFDGVLYKDARREDAVSLFPLSDKQRDMIGGK